MATDAGRSNPPYFPGDFVPGGIPNVRVDVPVCSVLLVLYLVAGLIHLNIFLKNKAQRHKFMFSAASFGFSVTRISDMVMRIVNSVYHTPQLVLAVSVLNNLGMMIYYFSFLLLACRIFRATHPTLGWSRWFGVTQKLLYPIVPVAVLTTLSFNIVTYYTKDRHLDTTAIWFERACSLVDLVWNLICPTLLILSVVLPRRGESENFGSGSMAGKYLVLGVADFFTVMIAMYRTGILWAPARPLSDAGWWDQKPAFYVIDCGFQVIIMYWLAFMRFDQKFFIPNGSSQPGDFSSGGKVAVSKLRAKQVAVPDELEAGFAFDDRIDEDAQEHKFEFDDREDGAAASKPKEEDDDVDKE